MHLVLSQEVIAAIVTVGLTVIAGAVGYLLREHATRAKPFVAILGMDGATLESNKKIDVPQNVVDSLGRSPIFNDLAPSSRLAEVLSVQRELSQFLARCGLLLGYCSDLVRALQQGDTDAAHKALYAIFNDRFADDHVSMLIVSGVVTVPSADPALPIVLPCTFEAGYDDGCYSISLPGRTTTVSRNLNKMALSMGKQRVDAFVELLKRLERVKLAAMFSEIERIIEQSQSVATVAWPVLDGLTDQNSQWSFEMFAANLGTTPFLVGTRPRLFVQDTTKAEYSELCDLVLLEKSSEGKELRTRTAAPLILRAQSDLTFLVVTAKVQAEMERGGELRQVFKSGKARCQIKFEADQVGFRRHAAFSSPNVPFMSTEQVS